MSTVYLLLWLEGPMQSWGADSKFGRRNTLNFPTKSGLLGLICCSMGASGEQRGLLSRMAMLSTTAISFVRTRDNKPMPREPLLHDFHMVGSGYKDKDPWQSLLIPKTSKGDKAVGGGVKITNRYYLQDSYFASILEVPIDLVNGFMDALKNPVWDLYLGRKCCVPTDFVLKGKFETEAQASIKAAAIATEKELTEDFRVIDGKHEGESLILNDVPIQFGKHKLYRDRHVTVITK
jgi:CRISPR system Cascade subunit CasD